MMLRPVDESSDLEDDDGPGLMAGITVYHLRALCENPWNGGRGCLPEEVGRMTLDQILFMLCDKDLLKDKVGGRVKRVKSEGLGGLVKTDDDGSVKARTADGKIIKLKTTGKSKVQMILEQQAKEREAQKGKKKRRSGRGGTRNDSIHSHEHSQWQDVRREDDSQYGK